MEYTVVLNGALYGEYGFATEQLAREFLFEEGFLGGSIFAPDGSFIDTNEIPFEG